MSEIERMLDWEVKAYNMMGMPPLMQSFVKRHGKPYKPVRPWKDQGQPRHCFQNSYNLAYETGATYVEGYVVLTGVPYLVHHAWIEVNGKAYDPTIKMPKEYEYYGIAFDFATVQEQLQKLGYFGLLCVNDMVNADFIFEQDPELHDLFKNRVRPNPAVMMGAGHVYG